MYQLRWALVLETIIFGRNKHKYMSSKWGLLLPVSKPNKVKFQLPSAGDEIPNDGYIYPNVEDPDQRAHAHADLNLLCSN